MADKPRHKGSRDVSTTSQPVQTNRLCAATSPYLRQHAHNPVDWYEWGPAALQRARTEDKPIFLSIGYSACHWCHVMAHESFEDPDVAAVMNKLFVNVKVDREERPDLDEIYMQATLILNDGQGGWPMSVWLTPELKPFFAGTYFPPTSRYGRPGFKQVCRKIGQAWKEHREEIVEQADKLTQAVRENLHAAPADTAHLTLATVDETAEKLAGAFDTVSGGLTSGSHKFPPSMAMDLMLRSTLRRPEGAGRRRQLIELTELTLDHMAAGGIYDQLGGGIHRYSTDVEWHVPHFEKMLYDQALVSRIYLDAYQLTDKPLYARIAREIFDYVLGDLQSPAGGFYSTRDADSEGGEGKYYVWTRAEVLDTLGKENGKLFCAHFDISATGNWNDPHDPDAAKSIPRALRDYECCARLYGITLEECERRLRLAKEQLLAVRARRVPPGLDDKILCEWNGFMIASLARGGSVLGERKYIDAAARAADFILENMYQDGRLRRAYRDGHLLEAAFLSDYAGLIEGLLELYEATFDQRWLETAADLNQTVIKHYWDEAGGGFFFTAADHEQLIVRSKDVRDNAVPSGNSVQLMNLLRLSILLGDARLRVLADKQMAAFAGEIERSHWSSERFLAGVDFALAQPVEVALVGDPSQPETQALLSQIHQSYLPNRVLMLHNPERPSADVKSPLLRNRPLVDGKPTAYVCRNFTCRQPVTTPRELAKQLAWRAWEGNKGTK
ncbi:MAG: thioredoxin domain-containing protein [Phycisphaerae bacterium]|nr:thioredoxin domain-containing protein [Phycisphaerae bacterium]